MRAPNEGQMRGATCRRFRWIGKCARLRGDLVFAVWLAWGRPFADGCLITPKPVAGFRYRRRYEVGC